MRLSAGRSGVDADAAVAALAASRCPELGAFQAGSEASALRLRWEGTPAQAPPRANALGAAGAYAVAGDEVKVWLPEDPLAAEAALRLAFAVAFHGQGGLLLHAAGICFGGGGAWLGVGSSGCGKSTLAQRCADAGGEVLSDETVGWLPDGTVWPTPFRSSARFVRRGAPAPLSVLAFLEHGDAERLEPLPAAEAVRRLLAQVYRTPGAPVLHAAALIARAGAQRFRFRNDPEAAAFVKRALGGE